MRVSLSQTVSHRPFNREPGLMAEDAAFPAKAVNAKMTAAEEIGLLEAVRKAINRMDSELRAHRIVALSDAADPPCTRLALELIGGSRQQCWAFLLSNGNIALPTSRMVEVEAIRCHSIILSRNNLDVIHAAVRQTPLAQTLRPETPRNNGHEEAADCAI